MFHFLYIPGFRVSINDGLESEVASFKNYISFAVRVLSSTLGGLYILWPLVYHLFSTVAAGAIVWVKLNQLGNDK